MKPDIDTDQKSTPAGEADSGGRAPMSGSPLWLLFQHMSRNHGLTLLDSELSDICHAVDAIEKSSE